MDVTYFKSALDKSLLDSLWNHYWVSAVKPELCKSCSWSKLQASMATGHTCAVVQTVGLFSNLTNLKGEHLVFIILAHERRVHHWPGALTLPAISELYL